jgi:hypothetical protein
VGDSSPICAGDLASWSVLLIADCVTEVSCTCCTECYFDDDDDTCNHASSDLDNKVNIDHSYIRDGVGEDLNFYVTTEPGQLSYRGLITRRERFC